MGLQLTHGGALSNLPLFLALDAGLFAARGLALEAPALSGFGSTAVRLRRGEAVLGTTGFTQVLADAALADPLVLVAGSGLRGMAVLGQPEMRDAAGLCGTVLTFDDDPMAVLVRDVMEHHAVSPRVTLRFASSLVEAADALRRREVAAITTVEPWISRLRSEGFGLLSDGTDVWGAEYPDTVLVAHRSFVDREPQMLVSIIAAMLEAEAMILHDAGEALRVIAYRFPLFSLPELQLGLAGQPPRVDLRGLESSVLGRWASVRSLAGLPAAPVPAGLIDFSCLAEAVSKKDLCVSH